MFFSLSKIIWMFLSPLTFMALLIAAGLFLHLFMPVKKIARGILFFGVGLFLLFGFFPIGPNALTFLERQSSYLKPEDINAQDVAGIVVLGGCIPPILSGMHQKTMIGQSCERITEGLLLHKHMPEKTFIYTGGTGKLFNQEYKEADFVKDLFTKLGLLTDTMVFERDSRNTYENAVMSRAAVDKEDAQPWVLVTSGYHMPRATRVFCEQGFRVLPYPVDPRTYGAYRFWPDLDVLGNYEDLHTAIRELIGFAAYWSSGKLSLNACQ